jgi:type I restriction enzyme S subunit
MTLRKGWEVKKLGDVCELVTRGVSPKYIEHDGITVINQKCIRHHQIDTTLARKHDNKIKLVKKDRLILFGDVLVNSTGTGTLGRVAQQLEKTEEAITVDSHVSIVRPLKSLFYLPFFGYAMIAIEDQIKNAGEGCGGQTELSRTVLANHFFISYPESIPEQQRIVEVLEEAFASIDTAIANTQQAISNAKELFDTELNRIFSQRGEGWVTFKLEELCDSISTGPFGSLLHKSDYVNFGTPLVNPINIVNDIVVPNEEKQINDETLQRLQQYVLKVNDIVVARRGEIGRCAVIGKEQEGWLCGTGCLFMRPSKKIVSEFIAILIRSSYYRKKLEDVATGATMLNLSNKSLGDLCVSIPSVESQRHILNHLDSLKDQTQALTDVYQQKLAALQELKQSLLHKAFTGELTEKVDA